MPDDSVFEPLSEPPAHIGDVDEPQEDVAPQEDDAGSQLEALRREREEYQRRFEQQQQTINQLLQGIRPREESPQQQAPGLGDLPDPVEAPDKFREALSRLVQDQVRSATSQFAQQQTQAQTRQQQLAAIRDRFWAQNKDLVGYNEFVESAYQREAARFQAAGINPEDVLLRDPDTISKRVAQMARDRMSELGIKANPAPSGGRTAGLSAGTRVVPASPRKPAAEPDSDLVSEIEGFQSKHLAEFF